VSRRYVLSGDLKTEYGRDLSNFMVFGRRKLLFPKARPIGQLPPIGRS
jgi:hypothetical protein